MTVGADLSRLGSRKLSADALELFLEKWSGEVFSRFKTVCKFWNKNYTKHIDHGKAARFDALGEAVAEYFTPGVDNLTKNGNKIAADSFLITLDGVLIAHTMVAELDELMNHYDERSRYADKLAEALAQRYDKNVAATGILAARHGPRIPGGYGGSVVSHADMATDTSALVEAFFMAAERMDDKDIPETVKRWGFVKPAEYYRLVQHDKVIHRDFDGAGSFSKGVVHELAGIEIVKTNNLPKAAITTDKEKYNGDFSKTVALVMTDEAVGTVKRMDLTTESEWKIEHQAHLMLAKFALGHGILRPECAVEIAVA